MAWSGHHWRSVPACHLGMAKPAMEHNAKAAEELAVVAPWHIPGLNPCAWHRAESPVQLAQELGGRKKRLQSKP